MASCVSTLLNCLSLKLLQPCIPFDAKSLLNWGPCRYAVHGGESASHSNIHGDQTSPRIPMDTLYTQMCQAWAKHRPKISLCELRYGTGCKNGHSEGYVSSLLYIIDTILQGARTLISTKVIHAGSPALSQYGGDYKHCNGGHPEVCASFWIDHSRTIKLSWSDVFNSLICLIDAGLIFWESGICLFKDV